MYLQESDLLRTMYQEQIDEIKRGSNTIITNALQGAEDEAKSKISRFDLVKLFGSGATAPTITDNNLKTKVTHIALWHLCILNAPGMNTELIRTLYEDAIRFLERCQSGKDDPDGWPLKPVAADGTHPGDNIIYHSEKRRQNRQ